MSPQRKSVQGSVPQRRLVSIDARPRSAMSQPQAAPAPKVSQANVTPAFVKPKPFQQRLPSAAELAALSNNHASQTSMRPRQPITSAPSAQAPLFEEVIAEEKRNNTAKKSRKIQYILIGAGLLVFIIGIVVSVKGMRVNNQVAAQAKVLGQQATADQSGSGEDPIPAENPIGRNLIAAYKVAPDLPRKLIIPKLGVDTRVLDMGLKPTGELKVPSNIYDTGWYNQSAKPSAPGVTLIDGHVHGPTRPGVFYNLKKLAKDDTVLVERGDGKQVTYKVVKTQIYDAEATDMAAAMTPIVAGKLGLSLITCSGKIDKKTNTYNERLIVFATIVE